MGWNNEGWDIALSPSSGLAGSVAVPSTGTAFTGGALTGPFLDSGGSTYSARQFPGVTADGGTDDGPNMATAVAALPVGSTVDLGGKTYAISSLQWPDQINLKNGTLLKKPGSGGTLFKLTGSQSATTTALTADCALGALTVTVTSSAGFSIGDIVELYDLTYKWAALGQNLELNRVLSIPDGTHITLCNTTIGSYAVASTATIVKLNAISRLRVADVTFFQAAGTNQSLLFAEYCWGVDIEEGCTFVGGDPAAIWIQRSASSRVILPKIYDGQQQSLGGHGYGIYISESAHQIQIYGPTIENVRENLFAANSRHCLWDGGTIRSPYDTGLNTHGQGSEHITAKGFSVVGSQHQGIAIGYATDNAPDNDISFLDFDIVYPQTNGVSIGAGAGNTKSHIKLRGRVRGWGQIGSGTNYAIVAVNANDLIIEPCELRGNGNAFAAAGINLVTVTKAQVATQHIRDIPNGYAIRWGTTCDSLDIWVPQMWGISSNKLKADDATCTNVRIFGARSDAATVSLQGTEKLLWSDLGANIAPLADGQTGAPVYGVTVTPNAGKWQTVTVTDGVAFTIAAPVNQPPAANTGDLTIEISNSSGGAMGVITWNATYVFQGLVWANPASTKKRFITFRWNGLKWVAIAMSSADY